MFKRILAALLILLSVTFFALASKVNAAEDPLDSREKLEELLFRFHDAYVGVSSNGKYLWLTQTGRSLKQPAKIEIFELREDLSGLTLRHQFELLNPVRPTLETVTPDGKYLVTFDEAGRCGNGPRDLVIYDLVQGTTKAMSIEDFLPDETILKLKPPMYMGGEGLREWQRIKAQPIYDAQDQILYPAALRKGLSDSSMPLLAINLSQGTVDVLENSEALPDLDPATSASALSPNHLQLGWRMADGKQVFLPGSSQAVEFLSIEQTEGPGTKLQKIAFRRQPNSRNFRRMAWEESPFGE